MNYGDHNFIEITQQTKLQVAPVALVVSSQSSQSSSSCRASRAVLFVKLDTAKCMGSTHRTWNLGFSILAVPGCGPVSGKQLLRVISGSFPEYLLLLIVACSMTRSHASARGNCIDCLSRNCRCKYSLIGNLQPVHAEVVWIGSIKYLTFHIVPGKCSNLNYNVKRL